ncbi:MAG: hypothetical protein V7K88_17055 [Nostoc sp.]|uniref:hypothetical protein n=1 Tax=Nostoc sp. TaxID=1180 RepID=UPI002FFAE339
MPIRVNLRQKPVSEQAFRGASKRSLRQDAIAGTGKGGNGGGGILSNAGTGTGISNSGNFGGIKIALGTGDEYFKGFGAAKVDGGDGFDTLDLRVFNRSQLSVSGVISGNPLKSANITFNNNGNSTSFSTTGFEKFIFADSSFCYSTLANGA